MRDLNALQFFAQVAKEQSFTKAASRLAVPKSSVSRAIRNLEARLGVRLLVRTTRSVSLTEAGEIYLSRCQRLLEDAEQADLEIGTLQASPRGRLRVGAPAAFARSILGPLLGEFLAQYPDLRLNVQLLGGDSISRERGIDISIRPGPLEDSGLLVKFLMRIRLGVFANPLCFRNRDIPNSPEDLRSHSCITTDCGSFGERGDSTVWRLLRGAETQEVRVESRVSVPDPTINHQLAVAGIGIAILSQSVAQEDVHQGRLMRVIPDWEPSPVEFHAVYPTRLSLSPNVRVFVEFMRSHFARDPIEENPRLCTAIA
jgi:DNA-binding transcriptional LysR family regulator